MCDLTHHIKFIALMFIHPSISCGTNSWTNSCLLLPPNKLRSSIALYMYLVKSKSEEFLMSSNDMTVYCTPIDCLTLSNELIRK